MHIPFIRKHCAWLFIYLTYVTGDEDLARNLTTKFSEVSEDGQNEQHVARQSGELQKEGK